MKLNPLQMDYIAVKVVHGISISIYFSEGLSVQTGFGCSRTVFKIFQGRNVSDNSVFIVTKAAYS